MLNWFMKMIQAKISEFLHGRDFFRNKSDWCEDRLVVLSLYTWATITYAKYLWIQCGFVTVFPPVIRRVFVSFARNANSCGRQMKSFGRTFARLIQSDPTSPGPKPLLAWGSCSGSETVYCLLYDVFMRTWGLSIYPNRGCNIQRQILTDVSTGFWEIIRRLYHMWFYDLWCGSLRWIVHVAGSMSYVAYTRGGDGGLCEWHNGRDVSSTTHTCVAWTLEHLWQCPDFAVATLVRIIHAFVKGVEIARLGLEISTCVQA